MKSPKATKVPYKSSIHNINRIDNYHWMRLSDKQKTSKVKDKQTKDVLDYIDHKVHQKFDNDVRTRNRIMFSKNCIFNNNNMVMIIRLRHPSPI